MNILFLAPTYMDLYKPIKEKLDEMGHHIVFIEDETPSFYPYFRKSFMKRMVYQLVHAFRKIDKKYIILWNEIFKKNNILNQNFDLLLCINGTSLHPYFFTQLRISNPKIRKVLYLWDTNKYYRFDIFFKYFDKIYTFDRDDAEHLNIYYLPFYYDPCYINKKTIMYDAFCIGTLHDNRLGILDAISHQMEEMDLKYFFRIVYRPIKKNLKNIVLYYLRFLFDSKYIRSENAYKLGLKHNKLLTTDVFSLGEYNDILAQSNVIIDTDRPSQAGLTPRIIWAMAAGKKIVTTNENVLVDPYCRQEGVWLIDRNNPIISKEMFVLDEAGIKTAPMFEKLNINNWVISIIS